MVNPKGVFWSRVILGYKIFHYFFSHDESIFTIRTYYHFWKIIWNILYFWTYCFEIISHNHYLEKVHQPRGKYFSFLFCYTNLCQFIIWQILVTLVVRFFIFYFIFIFSSQRNVFGFQIKKLDWILISTPTPTNIYKYIYIYIYIYTHTLCLDLIDD